MAQTTSGALKAKIESLGLSISAYRDQAPPGQALPYVVIQEAVTTAPDPMEDGQLTTGAEAVQIDVWQEMGSETYTLVPGLLAGLHGAQLGSIGTPAKRAYVCLVRNHLRTTDIALEPARVRDIIDLDVLREL